MCPADAPSVSGSCSSGSNTISSTGYADSWQSSRLLEAMTRQSEAMERLANLLTPLIAQNQMLIDLLTARDGEDDEPRYLDGTPR